ncbi:MAG TPA: ABC transporter permease [Nocardioides sp.]|nr:ABC transporter permease [Nocardioides sp.]
MRSVILASMRVHLRRYVAAALAVTIGVSFIIVVAALSSSARDGMLSGVAVPYEGADVVADDLTGAEAVRLRNRAADAGAEAAVLGWTQQQVSRDGRELDDKGDVAEIATTPGLRWQVLEQGRFPSSAGEAAVDTNAAKSAGVELGDRLQVGSGNDPVDVEVVALVDSPATVVYASIYLTWPDLAPFADGMYVDSLAWAGTGSTDEQADQIRAIAPDATVRTSDAQIEHAQVEANNEIDVLAIMLLLFAAIALFVSVLVIANTFSILFAQRQRDFALLRCVGATRRQVLRSIRLEALGIGVGASVVALLVGTALGHGVVALVNGLWPEARLGDASVSPLWYAGGLAVGVSVTLVAAWLPTRRTVRVSPLTALRPEATVETRTHAGRLRLALGTLVLAVGIALLGAAVAVEETLVVVLGCATTFTGVLVLGPVLVPALIRVAGRLLGRGATGRLATDNAVRNPRRTAATTASLLVGVTLTTAVLTGMASARTAVGTKMDDDHPLDLAVTGTAPLPSDLLDAVRSTPGVTEAVAVPGVPARVAGIGELSLLEGGDPGGIGRGETADLTPEPGEILLPEDAVGDVTLARDQVAVTVGDRTERLTIRVGSGWGDGALVAPATLRQLTDAPVTMAVWVRAADDADPDDLGGDIEALATPLDADVENGAEARAWVDLQLDIFTGAVVGLLGIAVVIALVGIANTLGLSVLERRREHALLRALGLTRRQLRATLALEAVLLSAVAAVLGTTLGASFAWVAVQAMVQPVVDNAELVLPLGQLGLVVAVAAAAGLLAGVLPARRAARTAPAAGLALE